MVSRNMLVPDQDYCYRRIFRSCNILRFLSFSSNKSKSRMELQHRSRFGIEKKSMHGEHAIGIPISLPNYAFLLKNTSINLLSDPASQYQLLPSPPNHYSKITTGRGDSVISKMIKLGKTMDVIAQGIRDHVRLGPKFSETVKGKLSIGARIIQLGGVDKVFKKKFNTSDDEKLLKACQCYLSTTAGPIAGLLFVSTDRVGFCSERSIRVSSPTGKMLKAHYKVMIPIKKIKRAQEQESENARNAGEKYVHIVTEDNYDFWFMGFLNHPRTLRYLQQAIYQT